MAKPLDIVSLKTGLEMALDMLKHIYDGNEFERDKFFELVRELELSANPNVVLPENNFLNRDGSF